MSQAALNRIEKTLNQICEQQVEICERIAKLEQSSATGPATRDEVIAFLDGFRAFEALGERSVGAWIEACQVDCLRGGLRTVQMREGMHARLLEERLKELGGSPTFEVPEDDEKRAMALRGSASVSDVEKLQEIIGRTASVDDVVRPIEAFADRCSNDLETQSLLQTIAQDERATVGFLLGACELLRAN